MKDDRTKVSHCTIELLMIKHRLQGVRRGKNKITTHSHDHQLPAGDLANRNFTAHLPNQLWVADFTYIKKTSG